jgi:tetratricopeptide (TPR) repeat protein
MENQTVVQPSDFGAILKNASDLARATGSDVALTLLAPLSNARLADRDQFRLVAEALAEMSRSELPGTGVIRALRLKLELAILERERGHFESAIAHCDEVLRLCEGRTEPAFLKLSRGAALIQRHTRERQVRRSKPQPQSSADWRRVAREARQTALRTTGTDESSLLARGAALLELGGALMQLGRYKKALAPLTQASDTFAAVPAGRAGATMADSAYATALVMLGRVSEGLDLLERLTDSPALFEEASSAVASSWKLRFDLLGGTLGRWSELARVATAARDQFAQMPELHARRITAAALLALADASDRLGDRAAAQLQYSRIVQLYAADDDPGLQRAVAASRTHIVGRVASNVHTEMQEDRGFSATAEAHALTDSVRDSVEAGDIGKAIASTRRLVAMLAIESAPDSIAELGHHVMQAAAYLAAVPGGDADAARVAADVLDALTARLRPAEPGHDREVWVQAQVLRSGALQAAGEHEASEQVLGTLYATGEPVLPVLARLAEDATDSQQALGYLVLRALVLDYMGRKEERDAGFAALLARFGGDPSPTIQAQLKSLRSNLQQLS